VKRILLNCEDAVGPFMRERCGLEGGFLPGTGRAFAVVECPEDEATAELLAAVWFESFNGSNMNIHVAAVPTKRWLTKTFLRLVFDYAFNQMGVRRLTGLVSARDVSVRAFDEHVGFKLEATLREAAPGGADLLVYAMHREDCRFLAPDYATRKGMH